MADKKAPVGEEKVYNIPLRRKFTPVARIFKTKKSVSAVREYIAKHTRATDIKISQQLNDKLWASGAKNPLKSVKVKVNVIEGIANARLPEEITLEEEKKKFQEKKDEKKPEEKKEEDTEVKKDEQPIEAPKEEKAEEKPEEKPKTDEKK